MRGVFAIKIIYNKDKDLRLIEDALDNNLDNLHFYIPKSLEGNFYCRLVDSYDFESMLKLSKSDINDKLYNIYKVSLDNYIACTNGDMQLSILFIDDATKVPFTSNIIKLNNLNCDYIKSIAQLHYIDSLAIDIINKYNKIIQLTEMNINIHQDIQEALSK